MSKWPGLFTFLVVSFLILPAAYALECDDVLQNVVFILKSVVGTYNPSRVERPMITVSGDGYVLKYKGHKIIEGAPGIPTDIFSENPNIRINFARLEGAIYSNVYVQGPRSQVLQHILLIKRREAQNRNMDLNSFLAQSGDQDLENFVTRFPLANSEDEVPSVLATIEATRVRRAELDADAALSRWDSLVEISLTFTDNTVPAPVENRGFGARFRRAPPPVKSGFEILLDYFKNMALAHKLSTDGKVVTVQITDKRLFVLKELYRTIDLARRSKLIPSMNPLFQMTIEQLNQKYPPSARMLTEQAELVSQAEKNWPTDPVY